MKLLHWGAAETDKVHNSRDACEKFFSFHHFRVSIFYIPSSLTVCSMVDMYELYAKSFSSLAITKSWRRVVWVVAVKWILSISIEHEFLQFADEIFFCCQTLSPLSLCEHFKWIEQFCHWKEDEAGVCVYFIAENFLLSYIVYYMTTKCTISYAYEDYF